MVVGLLGGVGSGKSTVAGFLADLGSTVLDADQMAHEALDDPELSAVLLARLGRGIAGPEGGIDRARLADVVFGPGKDEARQILESLVHPRVGARITDLVGALRGDLKPPPLIVLDVPLLVESPLNALCDRLIFVETSRKVRQDRVVQNRGWSPDSLAEREAAQAAIEEKRAQADHIITNDGSLEQLERQTGQLFAILCTSPSRSPDGTPPPESPSNR